MSEQNAQPGSYNRREFLKKSGVTAAGLPALARAQPVFRKPLDVFNEEAAPVHWLDGDPPTVSPGTTWGVPWPRGKHPAGTTFSLTSTEGTAIPVQTWPTAFWPDGSLKWTAHAIPADIPEVTSCELAPGIPATPRLYGYGY